MESAMSGKLKRWVTFRPWQRHGLVLMVGGLVYIGIGLTFMNLGELSTRREVSLALALRLVPLDAWATMFILAGLMACFSSRWPEFSDKWGYSVLTGVASGWGAMYLFGYILGPAPASNIAYTLVWWLVGFLWWGISGLMNPSKMVVHNGPD